MKPQLILLPLLLLLLAEPSPATGVRVRINEINANIASSCDLVELRVVGCGNMSGMQLWQRSSPLLTFSSLGVQAGDFVVIHLNSGSALCSSGGPDETLSPNQYPSSLYGVIFDTAFDWNSTAAGLLASTNVLTLYDSLGAVMDAVLLSDGTSAPVAATESQALAVVAAGQWSPSTVTGADYTAAAVLDLNATAATRTGTTIQRLDNTDHDDRSDWTTGPGAAATWGALNSGQSPTFSCASSVANSTPVVGLRLEALPSVASTRVLFRLAAPLSQPARIEVFDALGRLAATMWIWPGFQSVAWDGRDLAGGPAPAGSYFARVTTDRSSAVARVTLLR